MALKTAGKVGIRVQPDTGRFRADLKKALERIERSMRADIQIRAELSRGSLAHIRRQLLELAKESVQIGLNLDTAKAKHDLEELGEDVKTTVQADADTANASRKITQTSRPRTVPLHVKVSTSSLAAASAAIARLSGARVLGDWGRNIWDQLKNIDKLAPKLAIASSGLLTLASAGTASVSSIVALGGSLAQIGPAALALPGLFAGTAVGVTAMVVAFQDATERLDRFGPALQKVKNQMGDASWANMGKPLTNFVQKVLPILSERMTQVAAQMGNFFGAIFKALGNATGLKQIDQILAKTAQSIGISAKYADSWTAALLGLTAAGATYLPRLAQWAGEIGERLAEWVNASVSSGAIFGWIDLGVEQLKLLGSTLVAAGGVLAGFFRAASASGATGLQGLHDALSGLSTAINSISGQQTLTQFFSAARAGVDALKPGISDLGSALAGMVGTFETALPSAGRAVSGLISIIADALASPAFKTGLTDMLAGLEAGIAGLSAAGPQLGAALGAVGQVVGSLLQNLGPALGTALGLLGPLFTSVAQAVLPLVDILGSGLQGALSALTPLVAPLVGLIGTLGETLTPIVQQLVSGLTPILGMIATAIGQILTAISPLIAALGPLLGAIITPILGALQSALGAVLPALVSAISALASALQPVISVLTTITNAIAPMLQAILSWVLEMLGGALVSAITGIGQIVGGVFDVIMGLWNAFSAAFSGDWAGAWQGIKQVAAGIWEAIKGAFNVFISVGVLRIAKVGLGLLRSAFSAGLNGIKSLWSTIWNGIKSLFSTIWNGIKSLGSSAINGLKSVITGGLNAIKSTWTSIWNAIKSFFTTTWNTLKTTATNAMNGLKSSVSNGLSNVVSFFRSLPGRVVGALSGMAGQLRNVGRNMIKGLISGITSMAKSVASKAREVVSGAVQAAKNALGIRSPSRVFMEIGDYSGQGLIKGLDRMRAKASSAGARLASSVVPRSPAFDMAGAGAAATTGSTINISTTNYNPVPVPESQGRKQALDILGSLGLG